MKRFKNILIAFFIGILVFGTNPIKSNAANATVTLSADKSTVVVGNYVTYTVKISSTSLLGSIVYKFNYDTSKLTLVSGTLNNAVVFKGTEKTATYTFKFKAKASGSANVSFIINEALDWDGNKLTVNSTTSKTTKIITQAELEASYSKNNYLSSLNVDGYDITPVFNKNTLEYSLTVENDVRKINISANKEDSKSSVEGAGSHDLIEGLNKIEVKVTAQNGSTRTYKLNITVKELAPIVVEINGAQYNVVRKKELLTSPNSKYEESIIKINEEEVPAFVNNTTGVTLVGLKDEDGNIKLYSYDGNSYNLYNEFSSQKIIITEEVTTNIPNGYIKTKLKIDDTEVNAYQKEDDVNFYLIYATNIENGVSNFYQYDSKEKTFQLYNDYADKRNDELEENKKNYEYIIIALGSLLVITYLVILVTTIKSIGQKRKKKENFREEKETEGVIYEKIEQNNDSDDKIEENISEKEKKRKKKK